MMEALLRAMSAAIADWRARGLEIFDLGAEGAGDPLRRAAVELAYHNFQGWHFEARMRSAESDRELAEAVRRTFVHNRGRNAAVERLDAAFFRAQQGEGEPHSETPGMILDRLSILHLKRTYCDGADRERHAQLTRQIRFLSACAEHLWEDLRAGRKQVLPFERTKQFAESEAAAC
jgi:hypothetical protein